MDTKTVKTRLVAGGAITESNVNLDFTGVTTEELEVLAAATVIINQQAIWRTSGVIPALATIKVREQLDRPRGGGFKATPENTAARVGKMDEAEYRKTLKLLDLTDKAIEAMAAKKFPKE